MNEKQDDGRGLILLGAAILVWWLWKQKKLPGQEPGTGTPDTGTGAKPLLFNVVTSRSLSALPDSV